MNLTSQAFPSFECIQSFHDFIRSQKTTDACEQSDWVESGYEVAPKQMTGRWMTIELRTGSLAITGTSRAIGSVTNLMSCIEDREAEEYIDAFTNARTPLENYIDWLAIRPHDELTKPLHFSAKMPQQQDTVRLSEVQSGLNRIGR